MSGKEKKIAKWLGIVLEVCLVVGLALCVINGSVLDYCLRHLKSIVFILIYLLVPIFLYLKKYADIWKIVVLLGFVCFVNALYNYCGCGDDGDIIVAPLIPFIFATPIVFIYGGIIAFKRYVKKDEIGQTTCSFLYVFGAIWAVLLVFVVLGYLRAKPVGVDDTVTTTEMLNQVQHDKDVAEVCKITKVDAFHELNGVTVERDNTTNCVHVKSARVDKIWKINDKLSYHTADDEGNVVSILTDGDGLVHISVFPDSLVVSSDPNDPETIKNFEAPLNNEYVL